MPFCATRWTGTAVMSSPAKTTRPAVGRSTFVTRLNSVDFPAPFGPMTARISPRSTARSTASTARSAPKCLVRPIHSRSGTPSLLALRDRHRAGALEPTHEQSPDALRRQHDETDEHRAEEQRPEIRDAGQLMLEEEEEGAAQDRTDQRSGAADDHHDEHLSGHQPEEQLGRGEAREGRVERAGKRSEGVGQDDRSNLVRTGVVAERRRLRLVLADAGEHGAERRAYDRAA